MRKLTVVFLLLLGSMAALAAEVTGTWAASVDLGSVGNGTATFVFKQDGDKLTGTYQGTFGQSPLKGTIKGDDAEWTFENDQVGTITYTAKISGNSMKGSVQYGAVGKGTFTAEKNK